MRRAGAWLREGLLRLLGILSKGSRALWRSRLVVPLSWGALFLLIVGFLIVGETGLRVLRIYGGPLRSVRQLAALTAADSPHYRVDGLAYYNQRYEEYIPVGKEPDTRRYVLRSFYLLRDPDRREGILVLREGEIEQAGVSQPSPKRTLVAGRLVEIDTRLHGKLIEDGWGNPRVETSVSLHWMLEEVPLRLPIFELVLLVLDVLVIGFLLLSHWSGYALFWPEPEALGPADPEVDPLGRMDMQVTASLPLLGTRRQVRLVEALAGLRRVEKGWQVVTYDEGVSSPISITLPATCIEEVRPGRVYFGRSPRWGLWVVYRESHPRGAHYRLSLSFSDPRAQRAVYDLLAGHAASDAGTAEGAPAAQGETPT